MSAITYHSQNGSIRELLSSAQQNAWVAKDALFRIHNRNDKKYAYQPARDQAVFAENYRALRIALFRLLTETDLFVFKKEVLDEWISKTQDFSTTSHFEDLLNLLSYGQRFWSRRS